MVDVDVHFIYGYQDLTVNISYNQKPFLQVVVNAELLHSKTFYFYFAGRLSCGI